MNFANECDQKHYVNLNAIGITGRLPDMAKNYLRAVEMKAAGNLERKPFLCCEACR